MSAAPPRPAPADVDLSAVAWVHDELRRTLEAAHKLLRRFLRETESHEGSDVSARDLGPLRLARSQIHQGAGALAVVGLAPAAQVLMASDAVLRLALEKPARLDKALVDKVEQASFAVIDYLGRQLEGKPVSSLLLFPQARALLETAGAERVHPADLWDHRWQGVDLAADPGVVPMAADAASLALLEQLTLASMKAPGPASLARLGELCASLAAGARSAPARSLWQLAAAVFEAQSSGLLQPDVFSKRLASRLMSQLRTALRGDGRSDAMADQRLMQDLLFFCAQSRAPEPAAVAPRLAAVRAAHGLVDAAQVDYEHSPLGRFDPALVVQARKRVLAAKDAWSAVAAGEIHRLASLGEQFSLVGDSLQRLFSDGALLADELQQAAAASQRTATAPRATLAMEVATGLLYVEAALEEADFATPEQARPIARLAERIAAVRGGAPATPMEPWMEALYARVSDRQTLGTVVQELRASLASAEQQIDQFFRNPHDRGVLLPVPGTLQAMRGVLSVLGVDEATRALQYLRGEVEDLTTAGAGAGVEPGPLLARFERLASNLGALGFLIDMLGVQATLAKALFRFDAETGILAPVMGRSSDAQPARPGVPTLQEEMVVPAAVAPVGASAEPSVRTQPMRAPMLPEPAATALPAAPVDPEMREVFLEEAREVLQEARAALADWHAAPREFEPMVRLRRAFHTLKGSARMVGLADFGAAAWEGEQRYNARLADNAQHERAADAQPDRDDLGLRGWSAETIEHLAAWIAQMSSGGSVAEPAAAAVATTPAFAETAPLPLPEVVEEPAPDLLAGLDLDLDLDFLDAAALPSVVELATMPGGLPSHGGSAGAAAADTDGVVGAPATPAVASTTLRPTGWPPDLPSAADLDLSTPAASVAPAVPPASPVASEPTPMALAGLDFPDLPDVDGIEPGSASPLPVDDAPTLSLVLDEEPLPDAVVDRSAAAAADDRGDAGVEDIGLAPAPPSAAIDLSFLRLDLSEAPDAPAPAIAGPAEAWWPAAVPDASQPDLAAAQPQSAAFSALSLKEAATAVRELDPLADPALLALFADFPALTDAVGDARQSLVAAASDAAPPAPPDSGELIDLGLDVQPLAGGEEIGGEVGADHQGAAPDRADEDALDLADEDESVKLIGPLRIGIPLFNIYLNEADELSRRLSTGLAEWAMERHLPLPDAPIEQAHSLAGNSATVGYAALCELARALERALSQVQTMGRRGLAGSAADAQLFNDAADEIRRLLHQFAAGFLKSPSPDLIERLAAHEQDCAQRLQAHADSSKQSGGASGIDWQADIDAQDRVDAELFPIFEEEAQDLLPRLAAALREWLRSPDDLAAADAAMRQLHTFKGGARLAGALRLGELAHRLETEIERLATGGVAAGAVDVEALLGGSDALQHAFEALRESDAQAYAAADARALAEVPAPAALAAPPPPVEPPVVGEAAVQAAAPIATEALPEPAAVSALAPAATAPAAQGTAAAVVPASGGIDWSQFAEPPTAGATLPIERSSAASQAAVRVRAAVLERMVNQAGEVNISRARIEVEMGQVRAAVNDLSDNLERLRLQLHDIELQAETQMSSRIEATKAAAQEFDPLEIDRFTRFQELTRMMAESVNDVATVQRTLKRTVERAEDELAAQTRLTRDLQADLLRTRMVEFETLAERLHRVVRHAAKETGKQVSLEIVGGSIEVDRGMLERLTPSFEHLLRNAVTHGIEVPALRIAAAKAPTGVLLMTLHQQGNEVGIELRDDGAGLDISRIRAKAFALGLPVVDGQEQELIFHPGFSTAEQLTELAGRGVGLDVVRTEVMAVGGRVEVTSRPGQGTVFSLLLPLTTAVTQVLMLRCGEFTVAVPATLVERVRRVGPEELADAQASGRYAFGDQMLPFYWFAALLQHSGGSAEPPGRTSPVVVVRSAQQRLALHVDEVLGHQEAVVKHLGPQLSRMPGLAGMSVLASGTVALIYNPLVLAAFYGEAARALSLAASPMAALVAPAGRKPAGEAAASRPAAPLVLVVDDSLTVRRVTQRMLVREGYRVQLAKDGLEALERVAAERPMLVLSDIEMPRMDGFELVRSLRADAALRDLPVVMISSRIAPKHREHAAALGVDHYLGKPYSEEDLLALVRRLVGRDAALSVPEELGAAADAAPALTTA